MKKDQGKIVSNKLVVLHNYKYPNLCPWSLPPMKKKMTATIEILLLWQYNFFCYPSSWIRHGHCCNWQNEDDGNLSTPSRVSFVYINTLHAWVENGWYQSHSGFSYYNMFFSWTKNKLEQKTILQEGRRGEHWLASLW